MTVGWSPDCECPGCGRTPNIGFSPGEVERAKRERQAARVTSVQCTRCGTRYWIRGRDIARAQPPGLLMLVEPGTAAVLRREGLTSAVEVERSLRAGTLGEVDGIGPGRLREIAEALDSSARAVVA